MRTGMNGARRGPCSERAGLAWAGSQPRHAPAACLKWSRDSGSHLAATGRTRTQRKVQLMKLLLAGQFPQATTRPQCKCGRLPRRAGSVGRLGPAAAGADGDGEGDAEGGGGAHLGGDQGGEGLQFAGGDLEDELVVDL